MTQEQLIPLIAIAVVIPLVLLRNRRPRTLRIEYMWVAPLLVVAAIGFGIWGMAVSGRGHAPVEPLSLLILEAFMLFAAGTVVVQRIEMWIRARNIRHGGADAHVETEA